MYTLTDEQVEAFAQDISKSWDEGYRLWEEGRLPSPSPRDLYLVVHHVLPIGIPDSVEDYIDQLEQEGLDSLEVARRVVRRAYGMTKPCIDCGDEFKLVHEKQRRCGPCNAVDQLG